MDFNKKFSIGLPVLDTVEEFDFFLDKYSPYIENVYFSLPLGDRYHSRIVTQRVLANPNKKEYFLKLLRCVKKHGIALELLFNTNGLTEEDILNGKRFLDDNQIEPDAIGLIDQYYDIVSHIYPNKEYVYSFNNFPQTDNDFWKPNHYYHQYVFGRKFIRSTSLFEQAKTKGSKVVLLLNNGCSFTCGGCKKQHHCHDSYYRERTRYDAEYMYALQSILPYELHEGMLDISSVNYFKIASRNANVQYISRCMDSYIQNLNEECIKQNKGNYLLWSRLSWHCRYFPEFNFDRIRSIKKDIYNNPDHQTKYKKANPINIAIDLSDIYPEMAHTHLTDKIMDNIKTEMRYNLQGYSSLDTKITYVLLGAQACDHLLEKLDTAKISSDLLYLKRRGYRSAFVIPPLCGSSFNKLKEIINLLTDKVTLPDCFVVNDEDTYRFVKNVLELPVALGRHLVPDWLLCSYYSAQQNSLNHKSEKESGIEENEGSEFVYCDTTEEGFKPNESISTPIFVNVSQILLSGSLFCKKRIDNECDGTCRKNTDDFPGLTKYGKCLYSRISLNPEIISSILENRYTCVYTPETYLGTVSKGEY